MSKKFNTMIIIGGKNSSNTKELAKIAEENCENVYLIENIKELENINLNKTKEIGIMAGASTPQNVINEVTKYLKNIDL